VKSACAKKQATRVADAWAAALAAAALAEEGALIEEGRRIGYTRADVRRWICWAVRDA